MSIYLCQKMYKQSYLLHPPIPVQLFRKSHDRFLIIDDRVYHVGASLKDLGKKWFAILEMKDQNPDELISRL